MSQLTVSIAGLRAVEALAEHGSISAAAAALGYTPSAVSQQIARLERDLGERVIERQGRRAMLTASGAILAESARRIILELESMNARVQAQSATVAGPLTIAAFPSAARGILPAAMSRLVRDWPDLELRALEVPSHRAAQLVVDGAVDIAVVHDWHGLPMEIAEGLSERHLGDDVSDILVHRDHRSASWEEADIQDFEADPWLYEPGSVAHEFLANVFQGAASGVTFGHRISEYSTQVEMVAVGLGVALAPRMGRGVLPASVRAVTVRSPPRRRIHALWRSSSDQRPAVRAAVEELARMGAAVPQDR
ncbi:LysR family transcriptional regulator [Phycicoccus duodecadis]|uniref:DNA-binding transcriptional LysR family regulator n=1 Tax=Phycicoccus duodecadis TaxID=173053 RepID=A0A2N3YIA3_9MICO|nr:LysR family transcriptional regulator [Phycicoccus duodecadis]PKW26582.1 DNA-binding transcriptional LysR family regulator [Phycicoccus duodecadis]